MDSIKEWFYHHKTLIIVLLIIGFGICSSVFSLLQKTTEDSFVEEESISVLESPPEEELTKEPEKTEKEEKTIGIFVDIKGAIKNPGVYECSKENIIMDIINLAGGLLKNASTKNINLAKKVQDEMVIYIYTEEELAEKRNCTSNTKNEYAGEITEETNQKESMIHQKTEETSGMVSLNHATKEELMTLEGIGESKADKIIEYRQQKKFENIEELKQISGIGEAIYDQIKNRLTL